MNSPPSSTEQTSSAVSRRGAVAAAASGHGEERLQVLERLFLDGPETPHEAKALSTETLLDILLILYNECCNSSLRKEKTLTDFIELGRKAVRKPDLYTLLCRHTCAMLVAAHARD